MVYFFFFQAEDGIRYYKVTGVQTCALPILHVREEDWERRDEREDEQERDDRDAQDEEEQRRNERGDDRADGRERRVHPGDRQVLFGPQPDVRLQEVVLELRVAPGPCLDELPEHAPGDLSLRRQADIDRLGSLRELHHVGALVGLLAGAEPLRLRERASRLEFIERRATQPSRLPSPRPS